MPKTDYTREELLAICERAIVPETDWDDRDSSAAQRNVGQCWALLRAGCAFVVCTAEGEYAKGILRGDMGCVTNDKTIWLELSFEGFHQFEGADGKEIETFYLPTPARLETAAGKDWY